MNEAGFVQFADMLFAFKEVMFHAGKASAYEQIAGWAERSGKQRLAELAKDAAGRLDDVEADFNRMCIGPYRLTVPPYESVWRSNERIMNNIYSAAVEHSYAELGLAVGQAMNEPCDFFAYELEFMYCAAALFSQNKAAGNNENCEVLEEMMWRFWAEHLGHWAGKFLEAFAKDSREEFWREWAVELKSELERYTNHVQLSNFMTGTEQVVEFSKRKSEKRN